MATVVSHAMRRFASSPDANFSSCGLRSENPRWSQENESSLSRSMRYADPWLYDSVRGSPNGLLLAPALVLCSCPDYLNGTKRSSKKTPTTCKKCKATRLPFPSGDSKFGTVRCFPTASLAQTPPTRAGTVRVTSSSRPSILPAADPYDLMRRSRLSVTESPNQFRARSISPSKARSDSKKQKPKYSTVGRRSILECNVNPYDLMSTGHEEKDSSITLVNGQRIRVRPPICEPDYEDVQVRKSQIPKPSKMKPKSATSSSPKSNEKESESNRFKSILKKPTATFSDTDSSHGPERSPSPAHKTGSHFYLPLPTSPPRKKVQFLVEPAHSKIPLTPPPPPSSPPPPPPIKKEIKPEKEVFYEYKETVDPIEEFYDYNEDLNDDVFYDCDDVADTPKVKEQTELYKEKKVVEEQHINQDAEEEASLPKPQTDKIKHGAAVRSCKLRRSESERSVKDRSRRIVFCDSMALRGKAKKTDSRIVFTAEELERLDGITNAKLSKIKPEEPPPEPPQQDAKVEVKEEVKNEVKEEINVEVQNEVKFEVKTVIKEEMPPSAPPRKRSSRIKEEKLEDEDKVLIKTYQEADKILIKTDYQRKDKNKTILQINACEPSVHKLKIKNEFPETNNINTISISDNHLGKTSIMINGDDCYSTIKVCDEIPLYHSSVVVKDSGIVIENKKSSTVYITGNFVNTFVEEKTLPETKETMNDDIFKCLNDPVEAVRLNLVPHVCGKAHVKNTQPILDTLTEEEKVKKFIEESFIKLRNNNILDLDDKDICSEHSSSTQYEIMDHGSECYTDHSNRSSITEEELNARTKFYELLADSAIVEVSENEDHHYESIKLNPDPIYEEIEIPPPLPANPPPSSIMDDLQLDKEYTTRSIFEGASKYDILSYLVDAKERGIIPEDSYTYNFGNSDVVIEEESKETNETAYNRVSHLSTVSDSSEDSSLVIPCSLTDDKRNAEIERNDSGVGSETSKSSLSKYRSKPDLINICCEDCEANLEPNTEHEPLVCRKCIKKRTERKEIITEIVETEEKYSRDLQIILEEFYQPMLVAGLLTSDQLSAIFLNAEELLENSQALAERLRDAVEIAAEQGDEDLQTVNIGKLFLEAAPMLHGFETYCVRQGPASLLLASLEKEKELLRIFLRVSQMENTVLRRMNLNSFLMVPVQRVTKYPLLLARLYKVTPTHHETREQLKEAQHKIELHLSHMNSETKDVPSKLWRRISSIPGRRSSSEMDLVNIKLRKIAVDVLEWNHDEAKFALEGRLLFTQPTDNNWRKGRTIKLTPVNALLVTNGKSTSTRNDPTDDSLVFSRQAGIRDAALLLVRDKNGRYTLLREPLYLDRCVIAADPAWQSYFEVQELLGKDTFIFKAEDEEQTKVWYKQLQYYAQGMGAWRKRRNALANIMINGMGLRS